MIKRVVINILVFLVLAGIVGGAGYYQYVLRPQQEQRGTAGRSLPPTAVVAEAAKAENWVPRLQAIGTVVAVQQIHVASQQTGLVTSLSFTSGDDVKAGTLLVQIDDTVERAQLASTKARLREAQHELDRKQKLLKRGNTTQTAYETALTARDVAQADLERMQTIIAQKSVEAPFDGRLGIREVDVGEYVSAGTKLVSLQQLDPVYVDAPVPERFFGSLAAGETVEAKVDAFPDTNFVGKIDTIDARVDEATRSVLVRAKVANPDNRLLPGMFADVTILVGAPRATVTIPRTAVSYSLSGDSVFVVEDAKQQDAGGTATNVLAQRFVKVGEIRDARLAILDGIKAGELVVTQGQVKLRTGMPVTVEDATALKAPSVRPKE